ncbi:hypothetical protein MKOR_28690 [Mycolicibacillus koreensis]|nr:hypothetical protein MKOR_28690 [Mycolicibacillus koreensis]
MMDISRGGQESPAPSSEGDTTMWNVELNIASHQFSHRRISRRTRRPLLALRRTGRGRLSARRAHLTPVT